MKYYSSFTICIILILFCVGLFAQNSPYNPYKSIGKEAKVLTLSNGQYEEFFDRDTIEIIGSAILNTRTMRVIGFVEYDTLYSEATLEPEVVSRWLSRDPLARKYAELSPYAFAANNPVKFVDDDGKEPIDPRTGKPFKISFWRAAIYDFSYDATKHKIVQDNDLLANLSTWDNNPRRRGGLGIHPHETNLSYTSKSAIGALSGIYNTELPGSSTVAPSDYSWGLAALKGTYVFLDDRYSESEVFYIDQLEYNILSVEENYITQITKLTRSDGDSKFNIESTTSFDIQKGDIQSRTIRTWYGGTKTEKYRTLSITETTETYKDNKATGNKTTKKYTRDEIIK